MSLALFFACLLALPPGGLSMRAATDEAQKVPWRKHAVIGALLGRADLGGLAVGLPEGILGKASDHAAQAQDDAYDQVQASLLAIFGANSADRAACGRLMDSLRRSQSVDQDFAPKLQGLLTGEHSKNSQNILVTAGIEHLVVPGLGGIGGVAVVRYPAQRDRPLEKVSRLQQLLLGIEASKEAPGAFLIYPAQSHTAEEFAKDTTGEVFLMSELAIGSLREVAEAGHGQYHERLQLFLHSVLLVQRLHRLGIPHGSDISPDTLFLRRKEPIPENIVLNPAILGMPTASPEDTWNADVKQLGTLLRFLFDRTFEDMDKSMVDAMLAFGKAMEAGAFGPAFSEQLDDFMYRLLSPDLEKEDLARFRIHYLRMAVEAEIAADGAIA